MADNVVANSGSGGATFATDEDTGNSRHFPGCKIMLGAENTFTAYWAGDVTNAGTFAVQVDAAIPAGDNNIGNVDIVTVPAPLDVTGPGTEAAALRVTLANDSTGVVSVDDGGGAITVDWAGTAPPIGAGTEAAALRVTLATDSTGVVSVDDNGGELTVDGTVSITANSTVDVNQIAGTATSVNAGNVDAGTQRVVLASDQADVDVRLAPSTAGGLSFFKSIDLDESEEEIKATAGQVYAIHAMNLASGVRYLKLYNATAATVVVGTTVPDITIPLPTQGDTNGAGFTWDVPHGIAFGTAITAAATTGVADADAGAPGANEVVVTILYQ